jgi:hypothetical protein
MAVQNRETVGTIDCKTCGQVASLHQTARGKRRLLYKRCGCGCDQRTGAAIQKKWAQEMTARAGYEHLKQPAEPAEPAPEPEPEPENNQQSEPVKKRGGAGLLPLFGGVLGLGLLLITAGKSGGA